MWRFLLCSATFLFLAVKNTNGSHDSDGLSPLVKDLCKYIIHFKRKHFKILEPLPGSETISNNDTTSPYSSEPLVISSEKYKYLDDEKNLTTSRYTSASSKIECDTIEEPPEIQTLTPPFLEPEKDSQNLQILTSIKQDDISKYSCSVNKTIEEKHQNNNYLDPKEETHKHNNHSYNQQNERKLYVEAHVVCSKFKINQNINNNTDCVESETTDHATPVNKKLYNELEDSDSSNQTGKTNITECYENCSSKFNISLPSNCNRSNDLTLNQNHNNTFIFGKCPVDMCLEYFLPYFKRCKLRVCKHHENISEGMNHTIHEEPYFSGQKYNNEESLGIPSENRIANKTEASNTTDLCEESGLTHQTLGCNEDDDKTMNKQYFEFDTDIFTKSKNCSCDTSNGSNKSNSDPTNNKVKKIDCSDCEDTSRICTIPKTINSRKLQCRYYRKYCWPPRDLMRETKHYNFINSCNFSKTFPQIPRNLVTNYLDSSYPCECENKCENYDTESCCETSSINKCNNMLCPLSLTSKQDGYHNCVTENDSKKSEPDSQVCTTNISDATTANQKHPWCKLHTTVFCPICKPLRHDYSIVCAEPNTDQTISQAFCNDCSCPIEACFNKDSKKELIPNIGCKILENPKCQKFRCCIRNNKKPNIDCVAVSKSKIHEIHDALDKKHMNHDLSDISLEMNTNKKFDECCCEKFLCESNLKKECLEKNNQCIVPINLCQSDITTKYLIPSLCEKRIINDDKCSEESKNSSACNSLIADSKNTRTNCIVVSKLRFRKIHDAFNQQYRNHYICEINSHNNIDEDSNKYIYEKSSSESYPWEISKSLINKFRALGKANNVDCSQDQICCNTCSYDKKHPKTCQAMQHLRYKDLFY